MSSIDRDELRQYLSENLRIVAKDDCENRVTISLELAGEEISSDFIDYAEVVRVVERLNDGEYN